MQAELFLNDAMQMHRELATRTRGAGTPPQRGDGRDESRQLLSDNARPDAAEAIFRSSVRPNTKALADEAPAAPQYRYELERIRLNRGGQSRNRAAGSGEKPTSRRQNVHLTELTAAYPPFRYQERLAIGYINIGRWTNEATISKRRAELREERLNC